LLFIIIVKRRKKQFYLENYSFYFLGYSLSGHKNMIMKINPDIQEAKHLRIWYNAGGRLRNNQITTNRPVSEG